MLSDIPWAGPLGAVRVGRVGGQFVANPTHTQMLESDLDLVYVGNETDMVMYEGSAKEITEADFNAALKFGQEAIQPVDCRAEGTGRPRRQAQTPDHAQRRSRRDSQGSQGAGGRPHRRGPAHAGQARPRRRRRGHHGRDRQEARREVRRGEGHRVRAQGRLLLHPEGIGPRPDHEPGQAPRRPRLRNRPPHRQRSRPPAAGARLGACSSAGKPRRSRSAPWAPAKTPRSSTPTPAAPPRRNSSCTTTSRTSPSAKPAASAVPGRREIGHGALAERSLEPMVPTATYPYSIRITSEIMESNGSSSMASRLRRLPGADGRRRADDPPGGRHQHRPVHRARRPGQDHQLQAADRHHRLGRRVLRHGLQDRRHREGHHRLPARPQAARASRTA